MTAIRLSRYIPAMLGDSALRLLGLAIAFGDALGIIAKLHGDGRVLASCRTSGEAMELSVRDGVLAGRGIVHFVVPARRWWEDIVFN